MKKFIDIPIPPEVENVSLIRLYENGDIEIKLVERRSVRVSQLFGGSEWTSQMQPVPADGVVIRTREIEKTYHKNPWSGDDQ